MPLITSMDPKIAALTSRIAHISGAKPSLRVGQTFSAEIVAQRNNGLELKTNGQTFFALLQPASLKIPANATFKVVQTVPNTVLKLLTPKPLRVENKIANLAKEILPIQKPLASLIREVNNIKHELARLPSSDAAGASLLRQTIASVEKNFLHANALTNGEAVHNAIKNSGMFFERELAQALAPRQFALLTKDFKLGIGNSLRALTARAEQPRSKNAQITSSFDGSTLSQSTSVEAVVSLKMSLQAALARIESFQLASLALLATGRNTIVMELPLIVHGAPVALSLSIECHELPTEQGQQPNRQPSLRGVTILMEIPLSNDEQLAVKLHAKDSNLDVLLWSDNEILREAIQNNLNDLASSLGRCDFLTTQISVQAFKLTRLEPTEMIQNILRESA